MDFDKINKKENWEIPDGYFEKLPGRVMSRIREEQEPSNRGDDPQHWKRWVRIAAIFILILGTAFFISRLKNTEDEHLDYQALLSGLQDEEIINYLTLMNNTDYLIYHLDDESLDMNSSALPEGNMDTSEVELLIWEL